MAASAREVALNVLRRIRQHRAYADLALNAEFQKNELADHDRGLVTELVYGVLRQRIYLDWLLDNFSRQPIGRMENRVADALRLGAYQLLSLDRVPEYAAVDESVKLAPRRAAGLVNALLRTVQRRKNDLPVPAGKDPLAVAAIRWSHPLWILREWARLFGEETAVAIAQADQATPPAVVRVNPLQMDRDALLVALTDLEPSPTPHSPWGVRLPRLEPALQHPLLTAGAFLVQGEASQIVGDLLDVRAGEKVADLCAAPGGKSSFLATKVGPQGRLVAGDLHPNRLRLLQSTFQRLGITWAEVRQLDAAAPGDFYREQGPFDRILIDAPCTALGTLAKQPEIKYQATAGDPARLADLQLEICRRAADGLRPGGVLLYSVCTLTAAETTSVTERFLNERADFVRDDLRPDFASRYDGFLQADGTFLSLPPRTGAEGMFAARFRRK
ncbi:MAG: 16S rRNA (cytosine(967)-C(5))-methyltransferase RsmB [Myxococcales bacterium]|nr:16S rRNA (cytosine(967)-C(5))-methyltransferase RsmB [Myxococcales bacterium]